MHTSAVIINSRTEFTSAGQTAQLPVMASDYGWAGCMATLKDRVLLPSALIESLHGETESGAESA